jgi:hypothetical protein
MMSRSCDVVASITMNEFDRNTFPYLMHKATLIVMIWRGLPLERRYSHFWVVS